MIMSLCELVGRLFKLRHDATPSIDLNAETLAIFCGEDPETYDDGRPVFWVASALYPDMPFPDTATDPEIVDALRNMDVGQVFHLTEEASNGQFSILIKGIELNEDLPILPVTDMTVPGQTLAF